MNLLHWGLGSRWHQTPRFKAEGWSNCKPTQIDMHMPGKYWGHPFEAHASSSTSEAAKGTMCGHAHPSKLCTALHAATRSFLGLSAHPSSRSLYRGLLRRSGALALACARLRSLFLVVHFVVLLGLSGEVDGLHEDPDWGNATHFKSLTLF